MFHSSEDLVMKNKRIFYSNPRQDVLHPAWSNLDCVHELDYEYWGHISVFHNMVRMCRSFLMSVDVRWFLVLKRNNRSEISLQCSKGSESSLICLSL